MWRRAVFQISYSPKPGWLQSFQRNYVKNIYLALQYESPFDQEEKKIILDALNHSKDELELVKKGIGKLQATKIWAHREKAGLFEHVEQLLDVGKFEPSTIARIGNKIIRTNAEGYVDPEIERDAWRLKSLTKLLKYIRPPIQSTLTSLGFDVSSIVAIKFNLNHLSFVHLDAETPSILAWNHVNLFEKSSVKSNFEPFKVYALSQMVKETLPQGDKIIFVLEDNATILQKDPYLNTKIPLLQFQASLVSSLNGGRPNRVFNVRSNVIDTLFELKIGNDRVSHSDKVYHLIKPKASSSKGSTIPIDDETWSTFKDMKAKPKKEQMASAYLVGESEIDDRDTARREVFECLPIFQISLIPLTSTEAADADGTGHGSLLLLVGGFVRF
eukprot:maker-scaffold12_size759060-snap-gene-5.15 protein:Tk05581 transcript:maker-scaffold12_size759060-snap-gene-5.15-mRNA-1 annotation:"transcription elongation mitochondrial"